jgi:DNA-binding transcriptional LysR family regulator
MLQMDLIRQLVAVRDHGTLSAAAESLFLSQPSLSRNMRRLEDELGVELFSRSKNRIELNATGRLAADQAALVLQSADTMVARVRAYDKSLHTVSIGSCAPGPLMAVLPRATAAFAGMTVTSDVAPCDALEQGLLDSTYTLAILNRPPDDPRILSHEFMTEKLYASIPIMHPAAAMRSVSFEDMDGASFIMYNDVGIWDGIVRNAMPNARFLLQQDMDAVGELSRHSALPAFTTDVTQRLLPSRGTDRVNVPFSDASATVTFYLCFLDGQASKADDLLGR